MDNAPTMVQCHSCETEGDGYVFVYLHLIPDTLLASMLATRLQRSEGWIHPCAQLNAKAVPQLKFILHGGHRVSLRQLSLQAP